MYNDDKDNSQSPSSEYVIEAAKFLVGLHCICVPVKSMTEAHLHRV